jgi:hypothetical protein
MDDTLEELELLLDENGSVDDPLEKKLEEEVAGARYGLFLGVDQIRDTFKLKKQKIDNVKTLVLDTDIYDNDDEDSPPKGKDSQSSESNDAFDKVWFILFCLTEKD